jgi:hypothetical protein
MIPPRGAHDPKLPGGGVSAHNDLTSPWTAAWSPASKPVAQPCESGSNPATSSRWPILWLASLALAVAILAPGAAHVEEAARVTIHRLEPRTFETVTGQRVDFMNRTGYPVHLQFLGDIHQVIQIPATGPVWAIFHRPGTHPYVVHIYGRETRALDGVISVTTDETHQWQSRTCDVVVEGNCIAAP